LLARQDGKVNSLERKKEKQFIKEFMNRKDKKELLERFSFITSVIPGQYTGQTREYRSH